MKIRISCLEAIFIYSLVLTIILYWCIPIKSLFNFFVRVKAMSNSLTIDRTFLQSIICSFKIVDIIGKIFSKDIFGLQTQEGVLTFSSFIYKNQKLDLFYDNFHAYFFVSSCRAMFYIGKSGFCISFID